MGVEMSELRDASGARVKASQAGRILLLLLGVTVCLTPFFISDKGYTIRVLTLLFLFASMAQSWNIVGGLANQISLGHAAFFGLGAYTSTLLLIKFGISPWLGFIAAILVAGLTGALLSIPTMGLKGHYFALATLAFAEVLRSIGNTWSSLTGGPVGLSVPFSPDGGFALMQFKSGIPFYFIMLCMLVLSSFIYKEISQRKMGYELRALKANPASAQAIGINVNRTKVIASVISAALMGGCGVLFVQFNFFFDPDSIFSLVSISIRVALICIIGGIGTMWGPFIGACFLLPLEEVFNSALSAKGAGVAQLAYGLILIVIILLEPRGLQALFARVIKWAGAGK